MKDDKARYCCVVWNKDISLSTSRTCSLTEHARGNKHIKSIIKRDNFFKSLNKHNEKFSSEKQCSQQRSPPFSTSAQQTSAQQISTQQTARLYTLIFDKSLNEINQESMVQWWDEEENEAKVRYVGSTFLNCCKPYEQN